MPHPQSPPCPCTPPSSSPSRSPSPPARARSRSATTALGTGDGLCAYLVYEPRIGKTDGDRNMMSNIHERGPPPSRPRAASRSSPGR
ncbi:MAG: ethanolamine ammonia-lyase light chain EutC [Deltaproteobacteria bacterium]|nr:ethanolamine ammonia-lyase light chain EutC [Deltaproteobacteria bacterium]